MTAAPHLDQDTLKALLNYEPETGVFTWRERTDVRAQWNSRYAGKQAGYDWRVGNVAYRSIRIFDWPFLAHRLAWLYVTGQWPENDVDHEDGNGLNNRWHNLRAATKAQNGANRGATKRNKTGFKGVSRTKDGRYRATIQVNGRWRWLGAFDTAEKAHEAYQQSARQLAGEFARPS